MKKTISIVWKTVKWVFIVFFVYFGSLFFREERVPGKWAEAVLDHFLPDGLVLHLDSLSFGFRHGLHVREVRVFDLSRENPLTPFLSADAVDCDFLRRRVRVDGLRFLRLGDGYYAPGNVDRDERMELTFPDWGVFSVTLTRPEILGICPKEVTLEVNVMPRRISFEAIRLAWPDQDCRMSLDGFCFVDIDRQEIYGEVDGVARQAHIRPLLVTLDVPVALPYMDGFTEVPEPCRSWCAWKIDLVHRDFDLWLDLHPTLGRYNGVSMQRADGKIHLHNCTQNNCLNYVTTVGPIAAVDLKGRPLDGTVVITGTNGYNTVAVKAESAQPIADVLKIGGFTGDYVGEEVIGRSKCDLQFRFPRSMTNNYEVLNGSGHIVIADGQLMRMKGFRGLVDAMPSIAPAITWFSDSTCAECDYVIENGILRTDNLYVEGTLFSIKMYGFFDAVKGTQDFTVRVQFAKKDSLVGKLLHPIVWPFTKLLLEFKLTGTPEKPKWEYVSVIDRVLEVVK